MPKSIGPDDVDRIRTRQDFVAFVYALADDFDNEPNYWHNRDMKTFLLGMAAWVAGSMDEQFAREGRTSPPESFWRYCADIIDAGIVYE
jgi:hypothetical protein